MARKRRRGASAHPLRLLFRANLVGQPHGLDWSPDGRHVAIARHDALEIVSVDEKVSTSYAHTDGVEHVFCAAWRPDSRGVVAGTGSGRLIDAELRGGWSARDPRWFERVEDLAVHPDGQRLAAVHEFGTRLSVFDMTRDSRLWTLEGQSFGRPAWSPDGGRLAVTRHEEAIEDIVLLLASAPDGEIVTTTWLRRPGIVPVWIDCTSLYAGDARYDRLECRPPEAHPAAQELLDRLPESGDGASAWSRAGVLAAVRPTDAGDALHVHDALHRKRGCEQPRMRRILETRWSVQGNRLAVCRAAEGDIFVFEAYEHAGVTPLDPPADPDPRYADGFPSDDA